MKTGRAPRNSADEWRHYYVEARCRSIPITPAPADSGVVGTAPAHVFVLMGPRNSVPLGGGLKRGLDILISSIMLVSLGPVMLMIAIMIFFTMGRPILFAHERIGFNGVPFRCFKFRTMVKDAKERLAPYLENNSAAQ